MASDFSMCMIFSGFITSEMRELLKNHRINILNHGGYMFTLWAQSSQRVDVGVTENFCWWVVSCRVCCAAGGEGCNNRLDLIVLEF